MFDPFLEFIPEKKRIRIYIHQITFPELFATKDALIDINGILYTGPDRKYDLIEELYKRNLWNAWQKDIQRASKDGYKIDAQTMDYFQKTKHLTHPPRLGDLNILGTGPIEESMILNIKEPIMAERTAISTEVAQEKIQIVPGADGFIPPKFSWSYTALSDFETCPLKCAESRFYKTVKFVETPEIIEGNTGHSQLESYLKRRETMAPKFEVGKKYADAMIAAAVGGELLVEQEITLNEGLGITSWFGKDAWGRAKLDVAVVKDGVAKIFDWKFGKEKDNEDQLRIFCIFLALMRRDIHTFISRYIWLKQDKVSTPVQLTRADLLPELKNVLARIAKYREAWDHQIWQAKTSGLCKKYCDVLSCVHCGKRK